MRNPRVLGTIGGFLLAGLISQPVLAQGVSPSGVTPAYEPRLEPPSVPSTPDFGTSSTSRYSINACEATLRNPSSPFEALNCDIVQPVNVGSAAFAFPVHLPTGALITSITMHYFDNVTTSTNPDPSIGLNRLSATGTLGGVSGSLAQAGFSGGENVVTTPVAPPHTVDNTFSYLIMAVVDKTATQIQGIRRIDIDYKLQVSPDPAFATFADIPVGSPLHRFVEALFAAGITAGCGGGNFCPNDPVTRGQMAVFLASALGLHFPN